MEGDLVQSAPEEKAQANAHLARPTGSSALPSLLKSKSVDIAMDAVCLEKQQDAVSNLEHEVEKLQNKVMETQALVKELKYTGKPYQDTENTRFAKILATGKLAVVKSSYFKDCLEKGVPFGDRASIPEEYFITGPDLMEKWSKYGAAFLVIFSYAWLTAKHPDPDMYHLRRIVRALKEINESNLRPRDGSMQEHLGMTCECGVILDYCSLWQKGPDGDKRTEDQFAEFKEGLKEINTPYAHKEITAVKLAAVPTTVIRMYDDRGWTLFECILIDGKAISRRISCLNVLTLGDDFDPDEEDETGLEFLHKYSSPSAFGHFDTGKDAMCKRRGPPQTPERFASELKKRKLRAESKGVALFTNGSDQPFILDTYRAAFEQQVYTTEFFFMGLGWTTKEIECLAEVLPHCKNLKELRLTNNKFGDVGAAVLAGGLQHLQMLKCLDLSSNDIGPTGVEKLAGVLQYQQSLESLSLSDNNIGPDGAGMLAELLGPKLTWGLFLQSNKLGDTGVQKIVEALPKLTKLPMLDLGYNGLTDATKEMVRAAAPEGLRLGL